MYITCNSTRFLYTLHTIHIFVILKNVIVSVVFICLRFLIPLFGGRFPILNSSSVNIFVQISYFSSRVPKVTAKERYYIKSVYCSLGGWNRFILWEEIYRFSLWLQAVGF